jgi:hypothetical protein
MRKGAFVPESREQDARHGGIFERTEGGPVGKTERVVNQLRDPTGWVDQAGEPEPVAAFDNAVEQLLGAGQLEHLVPTLVKLRQLFQRELG